MSNRKGELYMDRVLERKIKDVFKKNHVYSKRSGSQGGMFVQKNKASSAMKKTWIIRKNVCCDEQGPL